MNISFFPAYIDCNTTPCLQSFGTTVRPFVPWKGREQIKVFWGALDDHFCNCCTETGTTSHRISISPWTLERTPFLMISERDRHGKKTKRTPKEVGIKNVKYNYYKVSVNWNGIECTVKKDVSYNRNMLTEGATHPKLASIWKGGCAVNRLLYSPPSKSASRTGSTRTNKCLTILYACSLLWRRAHRAVFHVVDHPGPSSPVQRRKQNSRQLFMLFQTKLTDPCKLVLRIWQFFSVRLLIWPQNSCNSVKQWASNISNRTKFS